MAIEIKKIVTDDFSMKYCTFGEGPEILVMIPGLSLLSTMMFADTTAIAYKELLQDYTIYLFDRREDMPDVYTISDMARDTYMAVKSLGIEKANFFGTSQGGMIIQVMAIEHPELFKKMVLGSTVSSVMDDDYIYALGEWLELAEAGDIHGLNMSFSEKAYSADTFKRIKRAMSAMDKMVKPEDLKRFITLSKGIIGFNVLDDLKKIQCPVLVIGSKQDHVFNWERIKQTADVLGCESYFYEEYSHCVYDEAPDYKARLKAFFG